MEDLDLLLEEAVTSACLEYLGQPPKPPEETELLPPSPAPVLPPSPEPFRPQKVRKISAPPAEPRIQQQQRQTTRAPPPSPPPARVDITPPPSMKAEGGPSRSGKSEVYRRWIEDAAIAAALPAPRSRPKRASWSSKKRKVPEPDGEEVFVVKELLDRRVDSEGVIWYLVLWEGYPRSESTWEPRSNIYAAKLLAEYDLSHGAAPGIEKAALTDEDDAEAEESPPKKKGFKRGRPPKSAEYVPPAPEPGGAAADDAYAAAQAAQAAAAAMAASAMTHAHHLAGYAPTAYPTYFSPPPSLMFYPPIPPPHPFYAYQPLAPGYNHNPSMHPRANKRRLYDGEPDDDQPVFTDPQDLEFARQEFENIVQFTSHTGVDEGDFDPSNFFDDCPPSATTAEQGKLQPESRDAYSEVLTMPPSAGAAATGVVTESPQNEPGFLGAERAPSGPPQLEQHPLPTEESQKLDDPPTVAPLSAPSVAIEWVQNVATTATGELSARQRLQILFSE